MKTRRRRNVSEERLTIAQLNNRWKKTTENGRRENSLPIPIDLIMEIFSRLPAKFIARCRCVSKPWASILRGSDFIELYLKRSLSWPKLLFASEAHGELHFFTSPQPQNLDENSSPLVVDYHIKFSSSFNYYFQICRPVHGLVCHMRISMGKEETVIYNPSTGQSLLLPNVKKRWVATEVFNSLGYDPIDKQFKLLSMTCLRNCGGNKVHGHKVLTLGTGNHYWRMIKCCKPHYSCSEGICIDGVLYYTASENRSSQVSMVVFFDVRSEKFNFIQVTETFIRSSTLINYNGKLGLLGSGGSGCVDGSSRSIELYVLEDALRHEWSKHTYVLPALWKNMVGNYTRLCIVGMTRTNEIVLVQTMPFCVLYYNIERKTTIRLQTRGMEAFKNKRVHVFLNHVENLKLM